MTTDGASFDRKLCVEIHELTQASLAGCMTAEQSDRLQSLLCSDADARQLYFDYIKSTLDLRMWAKSQAVAGDAAIRPAATPLSVWRRASEYLSRPVSVSTGIAALVMALLIGALAIVSVPLHWMVRTLTTDSPPREIVMVARLTGVSDAVWAEGQIGAHLGSHFQQGQRLHLREGLAEITFDSSARVLLQGPVAFVVEGDNRGRLERGKLTAFVGEAARGFAVVGAAATVVDLGTEIGVQVSDDGSLDTRVFDGSVQVVCRERTVVLTAGESLTVDGEGRTLPDRQQPLFVRSLHGGAPVGDYAESVLADQPLAYWRLGDRRELLRDLGRHGLHGRCAGATVGARGALVDDADTAVSLDGIDDSLFFPHDAALSFGADQPFTLELWMKNTGGDEQPRLLGKIDSGLPGYQLLFGEESAVFYMRGPKPRFDPGGEAPVVQAIAAARLRDGRWHHVVGVRSGALHRLYLDGELAAEVDASPVSADNVAAVCIGSFAGQYRFFAGQIDEIAIYDTALTHEQIRAHYRAATQKPAPPGGGD